MPAVRKGDVGTTWSGVTRIAIVAQAETIVQQIDESLVTGEWITLPVTPWPVDGWGISSGYGDQHIDGYVTEYNNINDYTRTTYQIYYKQVTDTKWILGTTVPMDPSAVTNFEITNIIPDGTYHLMFRAYDVTGFYSKPTYSQSFPVT